MKLIEGAPAHLEAGEDCGQHFRCGQHQVQQVHGWDLYAARVALSEPADHLFTEVTPHISQACLSMHDARMPGHASGGMSQ